MSVPFAHPICDIPYLPRKKLLESMSPLEVFLIATCSKRTYRTFCWMNLQTTFEMIVKKEHLLIQGKMADGSYNGEWKIAVTKMTKKELSNCSSEKDFYHDFLNYRSSTIRTKDYEKFLRPLFRLYPNPSITNLTLEQHFDTQDRHMEHFITTLEKLLPRRLSVNQFTVTRRWDTGVFSSIKKISELVGKEPNILPVKELFYFPFSNYLRFGHRSIDVPTSTMTDEDFNKVVRGWCSSFNCLLMNLSIGTQHMPQEGDLLQGLPQIGGTEIIQIPGEDDFNTYIVKRPTDGKLATILRNNTKFILHPDIVPP